MSSSEKPAREGHSGIETAGVAVLALGLAWLWYAWLGDVWLNLQDEGFLWYGVLRVLDGAVPLRDFQSYDPARYYWCAAWTPLFGDGIAGLRRGLAIFQACGLLCGLWVARRVLRPAWLAAPLGGVFLLWSFPHFKAFEPALALMAVLVATRLIEAPTRARHFGAGLFVGVAACFGRNHGLYGAAALGGLVLYLVWKEQAPDAVPRIASWIAGVVTGYAPMLLAMLLVPGLAEASLEFSLDHLSRGSNLALPYPWPWSVAWIGQPAWRVAGSAALSLFFLAPLLVYPLGVVSAWRTERHQLKDRSVWIASVFVGSVYLHHALVRSDPAHLAQVIPPLFLALLAMPAAFPRLEAARWGGSLVAMLLLLSLPAALLEHPQLQHLQPGAPSLVSRSVSDGTLRLTPPTARYLEALERTVAQHVPADAPLFVVPRRPTLYALLGRVSPFHAIYTNWVEDEPRQLEMVDALERAPVDWGLVVLDRQDDRDDLALPRTHPLLWAHLKREFERVPTPGLPQNNLLLHRRR